MAAKKRYIYHCNMCNDLVPLGSSMPQNTIQELNRSPITGMGDSWNEVEKADTHGARNESGELGAHEVESYTDSLFYKPVDIYGNSRTVESEGEGQLSRGGLSGLEEGKDGLEDVNGVAWEQENSSGSKRVSMEAAPYDFNDPMFSTDEFRVWEMKIRSCPKSRPHDWTMCPFAHPGEKAKRRDPRVFNYCGTACAEYRKSGTCARGDSCMYAHGVFECWLHPSRYRTQLCTDGVSCTRRVCFFAHRECELRKSIGGVMPSIPSPAHAGGLESQPRHAQAPDAHARALTSAIQMLDPLSKQTLLEALQNDLQAPNVSSFYGTNTSHQNVDRSSQQMQGAHAQALIEAIQQMHLGAQSARRSVDVSTPHHASGLPLYNQYVGNSSRNSVDIGSLSRVGGTNRFSGEYSQQHVYAPQQMGGLNRYQIPSSHPPVRNSVDLGSLYDSSNLYDSSRQVFPLAFSQQQQHGSILGGRSSFADDRRTSLSKIAEHATQEEESEGTGSGGSSSVSTVMRSTLDGVSHSMDQSTGYERKPFQREFSLDNILAELPRSASQVDLLQNQ